MKLFWALAAMSAYSIHQAVGYCDVYMDLIWVPDRGAVKLSGNKWKFECDPGYSIQGRSEITCSNGLLRGERPLCAKPGCDELENPKHGKLINPQGLKAEIMCDDGYVLVGNRFTYCDGKDWRIRLGTCRATKNYTCDFESEDLCGWTFPNNIPQPWSRVSTSLDFHSTHTGPQRDHTFQNDGEGHFIRMETQSGATGSYHFESPIYPRHLSLGHSTCFQFHFFMFGTGVESLFVSLKPASMSVVDMWEKFESNSTKFQKCGNLGYTWFEHSIPINEMEEDFQLIFTVTDAESRFGDIAIDDVKFMMTKEECKEAFIVKDPCIANTHSGTDSTNKLGIYNLAWLCWVVIIMLS